MEALFELSELFSQYLESTNTKFFKEKREVYEIWSLNTS